MKRTIYTENDLRRARWALDYPKDVNPKHLLFTDVGDYNRSLFTCRKLAKMSPEEQAAVTLGAVDIITADEWLRVGVPLKR